jgi:hypothetical protein
MQHTFGLALAVDLSGAESDRYRYRLDGNASEQLVKKALPALAASGCIGSGNAVGEFKHGDDGNSDSFVASFQRHGFQELAGVLALPFGGNGRRRVQHQSQAGGSSGSR